MQNLQQLEERRVGKVQEYIQKSANIENDAIPIINTCITGIITVAKTVSPEEVTSLYSLQSWCLFVTNSHCPDIRGLACFRQFFSALVICPIAIAYSMGQIIKPVCLCPCVCLRALSLSRFLMDCHQN